MKCFSVTFVVQADTKEEAERQASAFLKTPAHSLFLVRSESVDIGKVYQPMFRVEDDERKDIEAAPHLPMTACKTCGKKLVDDGWVQFCSEECYDGS